MIDTAAVIAIAGLGRLGDPRDHASPNARGARRKSQSAANIIRARVMNGVARTSRTQSGSPAPALEEDTAGRRAVSVTAEGMARNVSVGTGTWRTKTPVLEEWERLDGR